MGVHLSPIFGRPSFEISPLYGRRSAPSITDLSLEWDNEDGNPLALEWDGEDGNPLALEWDR